MKVAARSGRGTQRGPAEWFTGTVWLDEIGVAERPSNLRSHVVTFEPGARTAWHAHPLGQILYVTHGAGRVCGGDGIVRAVTTGDTVFIAPNERHWHGAAPDQLMVHVAIAEAADDGTEAAWHEHVTDDEYLAPIGSESRTAPR